MNIVVRLNKEAKKPYYENLDPNEVGKNKVLWITFKLSNNCHNGSDKIIVIEDGSLSTDD